MFHVLIGLIHFIVCVALIFFILIQTNKGMGLSGAFGAMGGADTAFGSGGGMNIIMKITIGLAVVFALTSLTLSFVPPSDFGGIMAQEGIPAAGTQSLSELMQEGQATGPDVNVPNQENPDPANVPMNPAVGGGAEQVEQ